MSKTIKTNDGEILSAEEKRELRRQRRVRNLVFAYVGLVIFVLALAVGIFFGIRALQSVLNEKEQVQQIEEQLSMMEQEENGMLEEELPVMAGQPSEAELLDEIISSRISQMTLEEKVAGLFIVTPESITGVGTAVQAGDGTREALEKYPVGGIIYSKQNIQSEEQIKTMLANTASYSKTPLFLAVDEEGGSVTRVAAALNLENVGNMSDIGASQDAGQAYAAMQNVGTYLSGYGFNLDFAPMADVMTNPENDAIAKRSFGSDAALVSDMVVAAANGLKDSGITSCLKHFPGIGSAGEDTHNGLVLVEKSLEELQQTDLLPFITGIEAGVPMIMVGHISLPQVVGDNTPASMSSVVIADLLRGQLGFNGVVITDAMDMKAITEYYGADEAAIMALRAGADMILMPEDFELAFEGVITAVQDGTISEERINDSLTRVYRIKYADSVGAE
ncbi:MAG: beta-N-acetylhexosaminidase [Lachnospiraceae bacterium]|nr:beta-N-acetylhexosaminidase [Lachnospiraceae bacterium]